MTRRELSAERRKDAARCLALAVRIADLRKLADEHDAVRIRLVQGLRADGWTYREIGEYMGLSHQRVAQIDKEEPFAFPCIGPGADIGG